MAAWTYDQVAQHNRRGDCYVILYEKVYDLTDFIPVHPGGPQIILKYAGKDATAIFDPIHAPGTIEKFLPNEKCKGEVDPSTIPEEVAREAENVLKEEEDKRKNLPHVSQCLNLQDFELVARKVLSPMAWAYYSSASDDQETYHENTSVFRRIWFRPRILRNVQHVDLSTTILGHKSSLPVYITATALGRLGHPDGEKNLTWAAAKEDVIQMFPTLSSCSFDEIIDARKDGKPIQFFQLYVNSDRNIVLEMVRKAEKVGIQALFITVDAPQLGRREKDMRMHFDDAGTNVQNETEDEVNRNEGAARAISSFIDPSLDWEVAEWIKSQTKIPVLLKGVQCWEDCVLAAEKGFAGVVLSNHGGRQLDFAPSGIEVLEECVDALRIRGLFPNPHFQIFVDGGIRRATDVLKAVCLGATAVGIGRPFIYAMSAYGAAGVSRAIQLLKEEMVMDMRLIGATSISQLNPSMLDLRAMHHHGQTIAPRTQSNVLQPHADGPDSSAAAHGAKSRL
ncbi:L-lactate dehydrogenase (cytochrome) [Malassezia vespertilionis]|uniref:L-lactate dehydrogenase (cytochrome) n=1 Tax=Malassezia vespertilionis TaxID=2020962 RepID=A0A2N1JHA1_9BASI|nr:L-lactate dehydrogenase (cytochrome) [Malassezia vespertilionis]PKI85936.1 hypothetical protein MVES_000165 [Malassezia vespertilionis]WFD04845.1 L-lactate dehydrogenase (cytochrome) [Malassezia vespertilionis]